MIIATPSRSLSGERAGRNAAERPSPITWKWKIAIRALGERGDRLDDQVVFVRAERALVEPQHVAALVVQGNRLQPIAGKRLLQRFANGGLRIAGRWKLALACIREIFPGLSTQSRKSLVSPP
jgi:hypothetical protein